MGLKYEVESLDGLDESVQPLYTEKDGKYVLAVEGIPEPKAVDPKIEQELKKLRANNENLLEEKKKAWEEAQKAAMEAAKKDGNVEALEKSWQEKLAAREEELSREIEQNRQLVSSLTVGSEATKIAAEVFGEHADLMMPHVNSRLTYEVVDGKPKIRVLGVDGKPTAASVDDLMTELRNNPKMAPFVVGSKASGPGAHGGPGGGGAKALTRTQFEALAPGQKVKFAKDGGKIVDG